MRKYIVMIVVQYVLAFTISSVEFPKVLSKLLFMHCLAKEKNIANLTTMVMSLGSSPSAPPSCM